jgi:hypothetical protein
MAGGTGGIIQFTTQNTGAGNLLVLLVQCYPNNTLNSATDSQGNTWVVLPTIGGSSPYSFQMAYALNTVGGTKDLITFNFSGSNTNCFGVAAEYSGVNTFRAAATGATGTGTSIVSNNVSAVVGDLLLGFAMVYTASNSVFTLGPGFSNLVVSNNGATNSWDALENTTAGSTGNVDATFTGPLGTSNFWAGIAAFYSSSPSPAIGWSPVDSRVAVNGFGPGANTGIVDSQGNTIYSAQNPPFSGNSQVSDNTAIPPVDSRVSKPVDSRTNKPVNSRVAPPFGEAGEP